MQIFSFIASEFGVRFTDIHQPKRKKHSPIFTCTYSIFHFESIIHFEIVFLDFQIYQHKFTCLFSYHFKSLISVVSSSLLQLCTCFFSFFLYQFPQSLHMLFFFTENQLLFFWLIILVSCSLTYLLLLALLIYPSTFYFIVLFLA